MRLFLRFIVLTSLWAGIGAACREATALPAWKQSERSNAPLAVPLVANPTPATPAAILPTIPPTPVKRVGDEGALPVMHAGGGGRPSSTPAIITAQAVYHLPIDAGQPHVDWFIGSYVDVDKRAGFAADFMGGFMTYDGHKGTDFFIRDLAHMETGVPVLAARSGTVVELHDGENDLDRDGKSQQSNYIKIVHDDESFAYYSHLKRDSLLVALGQEVEVGQPLALVGNSGLSSPHPHLHFEVHAADGRILDIFSEQAAAFDSTYPHEPFVFTAGITDRNDPYIFANLSRYTPAHYSTLSCTESPYIWYKVVRMGQNDRLRTILIFPNGSAKELTPIIADQDYRYIYWYVYDDPLLAGVYRVRYFFNENGGDFGEMTLSVVCD